MRVARSIRFVPIAAPESASGVITSTRLPCLRRSSTWPARSVRHSIETSFGQTCDDTDQLRVSGRATTTENQSNVFANHLPTI
jgi:hypothetical protein